MIRLRFTMLILFMVVVVMNGCGGVNFLGSKDSASTVSDAAEAGAPSEQGTVPDLNQVETIDSDPRAPKCAVKTTSSVFQDLLSIPWGGTNIIKGDYIPAITEANSGTLYVAARQIGLINIPLVQKLMINASSVDIVHGVVGHLEVTADSINMIYVDAGEACVSTHFLEYTYGIEGKPANASVALLGRTVNSQRARANLILDKNYNFTYVKDFDVQRVQAQHTIKLVNSTVASLSGGGEVILQDTTVQAVDQAFMGTIRCLGTSRIINNLSLSRCQ